MSLTTYHGYSDSPTAAGPAAVIVRDAEPMRFRPLPHYVYHSPTGFSWGYLGSGPSELARCILRDHLGYFPSTTVCQAFKADFVAQWPQGGAWSLTAERIADWLADHPLQCVYGGEYAMWNTHAATSPACPACAAARGLAPGAPLSIRQVSAADGHACPACVAKYSLDVPEEVACPE
jgi:hypothetical protein